MDQTGDAVQEPMSSPIADDPIEIGFPEENFQDNQTEVQERPPNVDETSTLFTPLQISLTKYITVKKLEIIPSTHHVAKMILIIPDKYF